jgi:hypothetical protein
MRRGDAGTSAIKDKNFDCIRNLRVAETRPEHFDRALADGKVSTNVYLRRIHNHALGMEWLLKVGHPAPAMAEAGVQRQAGNHGGRRHAAIVQREAERGATGLYRTAVAPGASPVGRCLPGAGRHSTGQRTHDLLCRARN